MEYDEALSFIQNDVFCDPVKSNNLSGDLNILKTEVIPALMSRISNLEYALQRESEKIFKFKTSAGEL